MPALTDRDLMITRLIDAPAERLYAAWTQPELLKQWFAPRPYTTPVAEFDLRPGGRSFVVMRSPDGAEIPCPGIFLEVVPNRRLVSTDAYMVGWIPSEKPFMTLDLSFEPVGTSQTRYTAIVRHWTVADRESHEQMGFHTGWNQCADQLTELVTRR